MQTGEALGGGVGLLFQIAQLVFGVGDGREGFVALAYRGVQLTLRGLYSWLAGRRALRKPRCLVVAERQELAPRASPVCNCPAMMRFDKIGSFGLTEPLVGSATSGGMMTACRREGDSWVLNGEKKWIGNATFADINIIWARDESSGQVKGFVVGKDNPGFAVKKIEHKMALRVVQNGLITLKDCRVPEADRLQNANSFRDTANVLRMTRAGVAWFAVGCGRGAYEHALRYATQRMQFGKPIAGFQLVQDLLVRMLGNVTATQCLMLRLGQLQTQGLMTDEQASLAKAFCTVKCRETVGYARELLGGNGILLENHIGRFVADAEAIYSYEGTREMNTLIVGKAITGLSAFV